MQINLTALYENALILLPQLMIKIRAVFLRNIVFNTLRGFLFSKETVVLRRWQI